MALALRETEHRIPDCQFANNEIETWRKHKEHERQIKFNEQKQIREMIDSYWPWRNRSDDPRGFKNVHLDDTNPIKSRRDYSSPKRGMLLHMGKPGGGAPMITASGKKLIKTREDPLLRFQFGNDLRRTVDNTLRYKVSKDEQLRYKNDLDMLVKEKEITKQIEMKNDLESDYRMYLKTPPWGKPGPGGRLWRHPRTIGLNFFKSLGYTTNEMLKKDDTNFENQYRKNMENDYERFKKYLKSDDDRTFQPYDPIRYPALERDPIIIEPQSQQQQQQQSLKNVRLSPLRRNYDNNIYKERIDELVPIICEKRSPINVQLNTTDVTRGSMSTPQQTKWRTRKGCGGTIYLKELAQQMKFKNDVNKETKVREYENCNKHFTTWDSFWGRPGHGAPKSHIRKGCLERLLYPSILPIGVY